jgi:hypothetical protein
MCSKCENVLIGFSIPHPVSNCPLLHSSYCSVCCSYGHLTDDCPDYEVLQNRRPVFVEQLVSPSLLRRYKIQSQTPLEYSEEPKQRGETLLEIEETDKAIRQVLMNYSIQPSGRMKENRRLLKQLSEEMGRKLVYLKPQ